MPTSTSKQVYLSLQERAETLAQKQKELDAKLEKLKLKQKLKLIPLKEENT